MCNDDRSMALCTPCSCAEGQLQHRIYRGGINTGCLAVLKLQNQLGSRQGKLKQKPSLCNHCQCTLEQGSCTLEAISVLPEIKTA